MPRPALNIVITGACSMLARSVIGLLDADDGVGSILALDIRDYRGVPSAKLRYRTADVRDPQALADAFAGADAVVHLAFIVVGDVPDPKSIFAVNIGGSSNVAQAAADAGVKKLIYTSSVSAYGLLPDTPPLLTEDSPIRGRENTGHYYASTKAAVEIFLEGFARDHPRLAITRFRAHLLCGPNILRYSTSLLVFPDLAKPSRRYWGFRPKGVNGARIQYTHEEDLAKAIQYALHHPLPGAYNIAGEPLDLDGYLREKGKTFRRIPTGPVRALVTVLSPFSGRMRVARAWMAGAKYRNIMDCSKLRRAGFAEPLRTTRECLEEANAYFARRRGREAGPSGRGE
jgi:nucleoside-diphosphate-sugar epimerase